MKRFILALAAVLMLALPAMGQVYNPVIIPWYSATPPITCQMALPIYIIANGYTGAGSLYGNTSTSTGTSCALLFAGGGGTTTNALTAAATGGAAPGTTFNGATARTFDYSSFGAQVNLSLIKGTYADGDMCTYASSGTLLNCNTAIPSAYTLPTATSSILGGVKPDGTTISNTTGAIAVATPVTAANVVAAIAGQAIAPLSVATSGTNPGALIATAGTGNISALPANSAGLAAPVTGGTSYLLKLPATIGVGILHAAAAATADNVNESALTSSAVSLTADVSGILPVANGGTGLATLTAHAVQVGEATSTPAQVGPDSVTTHFMASGGSSADPAFRAIAVGDIPAAALPAVHTTVSSGAIGQLTGNYNVVFCTTTCSMTPVQAAAGVELCVSNAPGSATVITLNALAASNYYELTTHAAWGTAAHNLVSGGAATDSICLHGYDATHYKVTSYTGTWTD
jgi:hypothetical protein